MTDPEKGAVFFIGDKGVGKSSLIQQMFNYPDSRTKDPSMINWTVDGEKSSIKLSIRERSSLQKADYDEINKIKPIVVLMLSAFSDAQLSKKWDGLASIAPDVPIVVVFTHVDSHHTERRTQQKSLTANFRIYACYNIYFWSRRQSEMFHLKWSIEQLAINRYTDRLIPAKISIRLTKSAALKRLDLGRSSIISLYEIPEIFDCVHLTELILSNEWGERSADGWTRKVSDNDRGFNSLSYLPKEIGSLKNLTTLICGGDWQSRTNKIVNSRWYICDISPLKDLLSLRFLNVSNNHIDSLDAIIGLSDLQNVYANNNLVRKLPNLDRMLNLEELIISNNQIDDIDSLAGVENLKILDLHSNEIDDLFPIRKLISRLGIEDTKWSIDSISISKNPLQFPTLHVVGQGTESVLAFLDKYEAEQKINLPPFENIDIKLILAGNSNVGKSTFIHWLKTGKIDKNIPTTHWLGVETWKAVRNGKKYNVRIFDFGGQEYYHDTHHLFFSNRTAYVLLWDTISNSHGEFEASQIQSDGAKIKTTIQGFPLEYWLGSINFHLNRKFKSRSELSHERLLTERESDLSQLNVPVDSYDNLTDEQTDLDSNVLIVQSKVDNLQSKSFLQQHSLKANYPRIFDFCSISSYEKKGLSNLKNLLFEIFSLLPILNEQYLGTWGAIKQQIEIDTFDTPMSLRQFQSYCNRVVANLPEVIGKSLRIRKQVLFDSLDTKSFAQFLNDIGIILFFPENEHLKDRVFLNQRGVLENIYDTLLGLQNCNGEFSLEQIKKASTPHLTTTEIRDVIQLMIHFKIIFRHPKKSDTYIAPLYLPKRPPSSINMFLPLFCKPLYRYQYETFINKNVILDFFQHFGEKLYQDLSNSNLFYFWRDGVVLKDDTSEDLVLVQFCQPTIETTSAHIDIYEITNNGDHLFLKTVLAALDSINVGWKVTKMVSSKQDDFIPLHQILEHEEQGNWVFSYNNKYFKLTDFKSHLKSKPHMKKIFISYSKKDLSLVNKFQEHLSALKLDGIVSTWYCSELPAGSEWNGEIQDRFDEADIACFMISPNFMKTKYIHDHEIARAFERKKNDKSFKIVPIVLDFCRWSTNHNNLADFTALPYTAKPVVDFRNQNQAWYLIQECLRIMIDKDLDPKGNDFYETQLPPDVLEIYQKIVSGKVDA